MKKSLIALAVAGAISVPALAQEATSPHTFTGNFTLASDYIFRGISQSQGKPAVQGGLDYSHSSGVYVGTWASNVSWIERQDFTYKEDNSMEWDFYAGYANSFGPISYDLGLIRYYYPGKKVAGQVTPDSTEVYASLGWEFLTLKYSHAVSKHLFAWEGPNGGAGKRTRGSHYLELNAEYDLGEGWGVSGHVGRQTIKSRSDASYTDWNLGVSKDVGFGSVSLMYSDTNAKGCGNASPEYCWNNRNVGKGRAVLSFSKSF